jgi:hypothetical protein
MTNNLLHILSSRVLMPVLILTSISVSGEKYFGASQIDAEGGYSSEKFNLGLGVRAFVYDLNRPSKPSSNGDVNFTAFYLQKRIRQVKFQLGHELGFSFVAQKTSHSFDYGWGLAVLKFGMEAKMSESFGAYWDCSPIYISNLNLLNTGSRDFNRVDVGLLHPHIGIRLYI